MIKIAITGPESTGKSWLSQRLAQHFQGTYIAEYAREYLAQLQAAYQAEDVLNIAQGQALKEDLLISSGAKGYLFCDTDMLVCKIWQEFKYGKVDPWIEEAFQQREYALFLLCDVDLAWEEDPLREHPQQRQALFDLYLHHLQLAQKNFKIIRGHREQRLENAIAAVLELKI